MAGRSRRVAGRSLQQTDKLSELIITAIVRPPLPPIVQMDIEIKDRESFPSLPLNRPTKLTVCSSCLRKGQRSEDNQPGNECWPVICCPFHQVQSVNWIQRSSRKSGRGGVWTVVIRKDNRWSMAGWPTYTTTEKNNYYTIGSASSSTLAVCTKRSINRKLWGSVTEVGTHLYC